MHHFQKMQKEKKEDHMYQSVSTFGFESFIIKQKKKNNYTMSQVLGIFKNIFFIDFREEGRRRERYKHQ